MGWVGRFRQYVEWRCRILSHCVSKKKKKKKKEKKKKEKKEKEKEKEKKVKAWG